MLDFILDCAEYVGAMFGAAIAFVAAIAAIYGTAWAISAYTVAEYCGGPC